MPSSAEFCWQQMPKTTTLNSSLKNSADFFYGASPAMSPSTLLLGRAREQELQLLYKDPNKYQNNFKGIILFRIVSFCILVTTEDDTNNFYISFISFHYSLQLFSSLIMVVSGLLRHWTNSRTSKFGKWFGILPFHFGAF